MAASAWRRAAGTPTSSTCSGPKSAITTSATRTEPVAGRAHAVQTAGRVRFDGTYFQLHKAVPRAQTVRRNDAGDHERRLLADRQRFASRNADFLFVPIRWMEQAIEHVHMTIDRAREVGRTVGVFTSATVVCRPTQREADEFFHYYAEEQGDWAAVDRMIEIGMRGASTTMQPELFQKLRIRYAAGYGGWTVVGDPDSVANAFAEISHAGFSGVAMGFVNYLDEFPFFRAEVLPRLERLGLRSSARGEDEDH